MADREADGRQPAGEETADQKRTDGEVGRRRQDQEGDRGRDDVVEHRGRGDDRTGLRRRITARGQVRAGRSTLAPKAALATDEPEAPENSTLVRSVVCANPARRNARPWRRRSARAGWRRQPRSRARRAGERTGIASSRNFDTPVTVVLERSPAPAGCRRRRPRARHPQAARRASGAPSRSPAPAASPATRLGVAAKKPVALCASA
jgi:hypothetical protein